MKPRYPLHAKLSNVDGYRTPPIYFPYSNQDYMELLFDADMGDIEYDTLEVYLLVDGEVRWVCCSSITPHARGWNGVTKVVISRPANYYLDAMQGFIFQDVL